MYRSKKEVAFFGRLIFNQPIRTIYKAFKKALIGWKKPALHKATLFLDMQIG